MITGWLIHHHLLEHGVIPPCVPDRLKQMGVTAQVIELERFNSVNINNIDPKVELWSSLGSIAFQKIIGKTLNNAGKEHYSFFTPTLHHYSSYQHLIPGKHMLNTKGVMLPFGELKRRDIGNVTRLINSNKIHIRPDNALKIAEASQFLLSKPFWTQWLSETEKHSGASDTTLFWLFARKEIVAEYRCLVHKGKLITYSPYSHFDSQYQGSIDEESISAFVANVAPKIDIDDKIYILDLALTSDGELKVIELNCMATSGWYEIDAGLACGALVEALNDVVKELYDY